MNFIPMGGFPQIIIKNKQTSNIDISSRGFSAPVVRISDMIGKQKNDTTNSFFDLTESDEMNRHTITNTNNRELDDSTSLSDFIDLIDSTENDDQTETNSTDNYDQTETNSTENNEFDTDDYSETTDTNSTNLLPRIHCFRYIFLLA